MSAAVAGDDGAHMLAELGLSVAAEFFPGAEARRVVHAVEEEHAVEMVTLVLIGAGCDPADDPVDRLALSVLRLYPDLGVSPDLSAKVRHRQATFVVLEALLTHRCEHRVDQDRQGDVWLVGVAGVVLDLEGADFDWPIDLIGGEPSSVGVVHGLDQIVDEGLELGRREFFETDASGRLAEDRASYRGDLEEGHRLVE